MDVSDVVVFSSLFYWRGVFAFGNANVSIVLRSRKEGTEKSLRTRSTGSTRSVAEIAGVDVGARVQESRATRGLLGSRKG